GLGNVGFAVDGAVNRGLEGSTESKAVRIGMIGTVGAGGGAESEPSIDEFGERQEGATESDLKNDLLGELVDFLRGEIVESVPGIGGHAGAGIDGAAGGREGAGERS